MVGKKRKENKFLKPVSGILFIGECGGEETIAKNANKFLSVQQCFFRKKNTKRKIPHTRKTSIRVWELKKDASFCQMFGSLLPSKEKMPKLFFTEHQLLDILLKHTNQLSQLRGYMLVPVMLGNDRFVAIVLVHPLGYLELCAERFDHPDIFFFQQDHRVIAPKIV